MENLKLTRIDFRLIHGQVMTRWVKQYDIQSIVVIDDKSAKSPILKKILLGAAPHGVKVEVETVAKAAERFQNGTLPTNNLMILFKDPAGAAAAYQAGVKYNRLQVGGIEGRGDKVNICRNITMSKEDVETLLPVHEAGVEIYCQPIPEDGEYPFKNAIEKVK
ncbi:MAG: PTS system mannose/fructose/N-acetylgalactosamine-transporter subunit IIB [Floccifex sp.]